MSRDDLNDIPSFTANREEAVSSAPRGAIPPRAPRGEAPMGLTARLVLTIALAVAGMKKYAAEHDLTGASMAATVSGANTNFDRLRYISERTEVGEKREAIIRVVIPEQPGSFRRFCSVIGKRRGITELNYRYADRSDAQIFVGVQVSPVDGDREALVADLRSRGYEVDDLTDNEMAKLHVRYMVGGRAPEIAGEEIVYRFEFPERPGALLQFLGELGSDWNITLFHYRNHGAAFGRVLVGFAAGKRDRRRTCDLGRGVRVSAESGSL